MRRRRPASAQAAALRALGRQGLERYRDHPERFATELLGRRKKDGSWEPMRLWWRQIEIMRVVASMAAANEGRTFPGMIDVGKLRKIVVRSGQKTGKSATAAILGLWWWCTRFEARAIMTSSSARQVKTVLWKELRKRYAGARWPLGGELNKDPETGLVLEDGREVIGFSTDEAEKMAGQSGSAMIFLVDETSGIRDEILEAVEGNTAGGAIIVEFSNPTKTSGKFFDAFHSSSAYYYRIHISSEEAAAVEPPIPGIARREWIDEMLGQYGEDSLFYQVRVRGNFPRQGTDCVIALHRVEEAVAEYRAAALAKDPPEGRLTLGVDPARLGDDETVIAPVRGNHAFPMHVFRELKEDAIVVELLRVARDLRRGTEPVRVVVDATGLGLGVVSILRSSQDVPDWIEVVPVVVTDAATSPGFVAMRDQLWFGLADWLASPAPRRARLPHDPKLEAELVAPTFKFDARERKKVESKDDIRRKLTPQRSPDRADALALAVFEGAGSNAEAVLNSTVPKAKPRFHELAPAEEGPRMRELAPSEQEDYRSRGGRGGGRGLL